EEAGNDRGAELAKLAGR
ncbi:hypothetical protein A2U01_0058035, partial [Trifolium medium]|nr:hypothetical protein [Trifolium medium]